MTKISRRAVLATSAVGVALGAARTRSADAATPVGVQRSSTAPRLTAISIHPTKSADGSWGIEVRDGSGAVLAQQQQPMQVMAKVGDSPVDSAAGYADVRQQGTGLVASGVLKTPAGSRYQFRDRWTIQDRALRLDRSVEVVQAVATLEMGFNSRLAIGAPGADKLSEHDLFLPGVRYGDTTGIPSDGLAGDDSAEYVYVRTMRLSLPLVSIRNRSSRQTITMAHLNASPRTDTGGYIDERNANWWIHPDIQYASLGAQQSPDSQLALVYPGVEGDRSYLGSAWARRSHPVQVGFRHNYSVRLTFADHASLPEMVKAVWRDHRRLLTPSTSGRNPSPKVLDAGLALLDSLAKPYNGYEGLPFRCRLPSGEADAVSYVMGFIGQQAPAGYQLLRSGLRDHDQQRATRGRQIIDFWVDQSALPNGLPKLWIDGDTPHWRDWYPCFLRVASDGMEGILAAARLMRRRGQPVAAWEQYVSRFGNFLVAHQNSDGSFYRAYNWDGSVNSDAKTNTSHPIRFLIGLGVLTGDGRYSAAAVKAGDYYATSIADSMHFVGGTADNPNVLDKEGGGLAFNAFLALYGNDGDDRWLELATRAADYTETWLMSWSWPMDTPRKAYRDLGALGLSLIATGQSGLDNWICYQSANFYRLWLHTGDRHYLAIAKTLTTTSVRTTEYAGNKVGYQLTGLVEEAVSLSDLVVSGTGVWLPWCSVAEVEPLALLEDRFGTSDLDQLDRRSRDDLRAADQQAMKRI